MFKEEIESNLIQNFNLFLKIFSNSKPVQNSLKQFNQTTKRIYLIDTKELPEKHPFFKTILSDENDLKIKLNLAIPEAQPTATPPTPRKQRL